MTTVPWINPRQNILVCVDSYRDGNPVGRIFCQGMETESFASLSQFLLRMDHLLDRRQSPQSFTSKRCFAEVAPPDSPAAPLPFRRGAEATFAVQVLFRQHTSWQGVVNWQEGKLEQSFRSALELVVLMDSALRHREMPPDTRTGS